MSHSNLDRLNAVLIRQQRQTPEVMIDNATMRRTIQTFVSHIAWESEV